MFWKFDFEYSYDNVLILTIATCYMQHLFQPPSLPFSPFPAKGPSEHTRSKSLSFNQCFKLHLQKISRMGNSCQEMPFPYLKSCFPPIQGLCLIFSHPLFLHLIVAMGSKIPNFLAFLCRTYNIIQNSYAPKGAIALLRSPFLTGLSGGVGSSSSVSTKNFLL